MGRRKTPEEPVKSGRNPFGSGGRNDNNQEKTELCRLWRSASSVENAHDKADWALQRFVNPLLPEMCQEAGDKEYKENPICLEISLCGHKRSGIHPTQGRRKADGPGTFDRKGQEKDSLRKQIEMGAEDGLTMQITKGEIRIREGEWKIMLASIALGAMGLFGLGIIVGSLVT